MREREVTREWPALYTRGVTPVGKVRSGLRIWKNSLPAITMLLVSLVPVLSGAAPFSDDPDTVNYMVVDEKTGPFQIVRNGKSDGGIISDIVDKVFEGSQYVVQHHVMPVNRIRVSVAESKISRWVAFDSPVWNSFGASGEALGPPLFQTHHVLVTCSDKVPRVIGSIDDLAGLSVVTLRYFDYLALNQAAKDGIIRSIPVDRYDAGIQLVSLGRADGFIEMASRLRYHLGSLAGDFSCVREVDVSAIIPDYPIYLYGDRRWSSRFKFFVKDRLEWMANSGELDRIIRHYVPEGIAGASSVDVGSQ